jgi:hypothetical protein
MRQKLSKKFSGFKILKTREHSIVAILAIVVGIGGGLGVVGFRHLYDFFQSVAYGSSDSLLDVVRTIPWFVRIAIPAVGFDVIEIALLQQIPWMLMITLLFFKIVASSLSLGSGGSGGVFAPCLFMGAMAGGSFGAVVHNLLPDITAPMSAYGTVGMGAVLDAEISTENSLFNALELMRHRDVSILPIVASTGNHQLKGVLTHEDIISAYKVSARKRALFNNHHSKKINRAIEACISVSDADTPSDMAQSKGFTWWR